MNKPSLNFNGVRVPRTDFGAVRTQLQTLPLYIDIDLTSERSEAAGTALVLNISGNSVYCDKAETTGQATFHFQDTGYQGSTPITVDSGFIASVEFTQIVVENTAQSGKKIRLIYGVDIAFTPGTQSSVTISGSASVTIDLADTISDPDPVSVGTNATSLVAASTTRRCVRFFNAGTADVYIGGSGITTANGAIKLAAGQGWSETDAPGAAWYGISGTAGQSVRIQELS